MHDLADAWTLDPAVSFLNHGSFGACPRAVLAAQSVLRSRLEAEPVRFFARDYEPLLDAARADVARFVGADPADLAFVGNATTGVSTVLRSLPFSAGDELLVTDHEYPASRNALDFVADGAADPVGVVVAKVPFPVPSAAAIVEAVLAAVTPRTRLLLIDHVTSQTGVIMPIAALAAALAPQGIDVVVDGAHGPGMLDLDIPALGAAYYVGNLHKWVCAPKATAFLWVRKDRQDRVRPLAISHGARSPRRDRARFQLELDWCGTWDPTAALCAPEAIRHVGGLLPGGWPAVRAHNHSLVLAGRDLIAEALGTAAPVPDALIGAMASLPLPDGKQPPRGGIDPLQDALWARGIEVPVVLWPAWPRRLLRVSAHLYNRHAQYEQLAGALREALAAE